jgi:AbrB family looped-hinge helix DNA binding protein
MSDSYDLVVGTKRQVTIPSKLLKRLALKEGDRLRVTVEGERASLVPLVSVPRHLVSDSLLEEMEARRGSKASDLTLGEFVAWRRELKEQEALRLGGQEAPMQSSAVPAVGVDEPELEGE